MAPPPVVFPPQLLHLRAPVSRGRRRWRLVSGTTDATSTPATAFYAGRGHHRVLDGADGTAGEWSWFCSGRPPIYRSAPHRSVRGGGGASRPWGETRDRSGVPARRPGMTWWGRGRRHGGRCLWLCESGSAISGLARVERGWICKHVPAPLSLAPLVPFCFPTTCFLDSVDSVL